MASDTESLDRAGRLLSNALGTEFEQIPEAPPTRTADLASTDGVHIAEVKRVTSSSLRELGKATRDGRTTTRDVAELSRRWSVVVEATTNSDSLPPMPDFREPPPEQRAALEKAGFKVATKDEREAEFRAQHPGPKQPTVRVKRLIDELIPHFKVLEANGVSGDSYSWHHWGKTDEVAKTQRAILTLTRGGAVSSFEPTQAPTGVGVHLAWGAVRTERADTIAGRIQTWLESDLSENLRDSLRPAPAEATRHAVLVFDAASEPEFDGASTDASFVPSAALSLPAEVDRLWAVFGDRALSFAPAAGWSAHLVPPSSPS